MAADQPSVQSMAPSSNPHGTALPGLVLVGVAVGADDASPSSIVDDHGLVSLRVGRVGGVVNGPTEPSWESRRVHANYSAGGPLELRPVAARAWGRFGELVDCEREGPSGDHS